MSSSPALPGAPRHWSTDVVRPAERLDYWVGVICEAFLEMACDSRAAPCFDGSLTHWPVQDIGLSRVVACAQDVYRTRAAIARDLHPPFYLITQLDSAWHVRQGGQVVHLRPGDVVLVDAAQTYELHFPGSVASLSVELPRDWVGRWLREVDVPQARVAYRDQGWGQTLSALCLQLGREPALVGGLTPVQFNEHLGAVVPWWRLRWSPAPGTPTCRIPICMAARWRGCGSGWARPACWPPGSRMRWTCRHVPCTGFLPRREAVSWEACGRCACNTPANCWPSPAWPGWAGHGRSGAPLRLRRCLALRARFPSSGGHHARALAARAHAELTL